MGSNKLQTRQRQRSGFVREAEARKEMLLGKGRTAESIAKDPLFKHLKAKIKQVTAAVARISFLENQTKQLQEKKEQARAAAEAERLEALAEGKPKAKKKSAEAAAPKPEAKAGKKTPAKAKEGAKTKQK